MGRDKPVPTTLRWLGGPVIWAAHFLVVYASESLLCRHGSPASHDVLVAVATMSAAALLVVMLARGSRRTLDIQRGGGADFMEAVSLALGWLALLAIGWAAVPALMTPACLTSF